jgi:4-hydroxyacetophenone monooxygenase
MASHLRAVLEQDQGRDAAHRELVWSHPGVTSWYKNGAGRVHAASPWRLVDYRNMTAEFDPSEYAFTEASA